METGFEKAKARAFAATLVVAVALSCAGAPAANAVTLAAADFEAGGKVVASYIKGDAGNKREFRCTRKVTGLASSDPRVVSVRAARTGYGFDVELRKPGKAKVTYMLGGARRAVALKVVKYSNPVKSFKVGAKDYAGKFKKARSCRLPAKKANLGKLRVVAAKGWKLKKLYSGFSERNSLKTRNGAELGGSLNVRAVLKNSKTGLVETLEFRNGT